MSNSKAREHLDRLSERHHHDDDDFDSDGHDHEDNKPLPARASHGLTRSGTQDWDYAAAGKLSRNYDPNASIHDMVAANLPLARTIANDFSNIPGVEPEDIMTAAKEALYFAIEEYNPELGKFSAWLSKIIRQQLKRLYNVQREVSDMEVDSLDRDDVPGGHGAGDQGETGGPREAHKDLAGDLDTLYGREGQDTVRDTARSEAYAIVRHAISQLDPRTQKIVNLCHSEEGGMSVRDITARLAEEGDKVSSQTVWKYLNKGLERVKQILADGGFVDTDEGGDLVHKSERPERPEPDYVDTLLAKKKNAKAKEGGESTKESRFPRRGSPSAVSTFSSLLGTDTAILEAADELVADGDETEEAELQHRWEDLLDQVTDTIYAEMVEDEAGEGDGSTLKGPKTGKGVGGERKTPKHSKGSEKVKESRSRLFTDRLMS